MKKAISLIVAILMLSVFAALPSLAEGEANSYEVVGTRKALTLDGVIDEKEWNGAEVFTLDKDSANTNISASGVTDAKAAFYAMWSEDGFYGAAKVTGDKTVHNPYYGDAVNGFDCVQFLIDPAAGKADSTSGKAYIFGFSPVTEDDEGATWYENWSYGNEAPAPNAVMPEDLGIKVTGVRSDNEYTVEFFIPWSAMKKNGESFTVGEGTTMGMEFTMVDKLDSDFSLIGSQIGFNPSQYGTATFAAPLPEELNFMLVIIVFITAVVAGAVLVAIIIKVKKS